MSPEEFEGIAREVKSGRNGDLLKKLEQGSQPYLRKVMQVKGFGCLNKRQVMAELVPAAVGEAMARWCPARQRFIGKLWSVFLHCCRAKMRERRKQAAAEAFRKLAAVDTAAPLTPLTQASLNEMISLAKKALQHESDRSRRVVMGWMKGEPYEAIAPIVGESADRCRGIKYENIQNMIRRLSGHGDLFEA